MAIRGDFKTDSGILISNYFIDNFENNEIGGIQNSG
jgi:hypothetical protein